MTFWIRISALNDDDSSEDENVSLPAHRTATKEAQEAEAFALYNKALSFMRQGENGRAEKVFQQLLATPLVRETAPPSSEVEGLVQPGLMLKYSTHKNLASMASQRQEYEAAMENYLEAVMLDSSDVTVWFKMGKVALKLHHYPLARHAFEQGLENNPRHWPCLDNVVTVLYALNNYEVCLYYIAQALERDPGYVKGLVFRHQIFQEQPSLRKYSIEVFKSCDPAINTTKVEPDEIEEYVTEAVEMRRKKQELSRRPDLPVLNFRQPLQGFSWIALGESLVSTYDYVSKAPRPVSLACKVDVSMYAEMSPGSEFPNLPAIPEDPELILPVETPTAPPVQSEDILSSSVAEISAAGSILGHEAAASTSYSTTVEQEEEKTEKKKRGRKRKGLLTEEELAGKRRSARVRNTVRPPQEEAINYQELLLKFLPSTLLQVQEDENKDNSQEEQMDICPADLGDVGASCSTAGRRSSEGTFLVSTENVDVHHFIQTHQNNSGMIDLLNEFLLALASRSNVKWPEELMMIYIKAYSRLRKHFEYPGFLCKDVPDERIRNMAKMCLVHAELKLDKWLTSKARLGQGSPLKNTAVMSPQCLEIDFPGSYYVEDMAYMVGLTGCADVLAQQWQEFCIRVFWLKARFMMLQNKMEDATDCFDQTSGYLSYSSSDGESPALTIKLPHCSVDNCITLDEVHKQLDSLHRCQSLEEVQNLHEKGDNARVVELLLLTFASMDTKIKVVEIEIQERHAQLLLLQDSLHKLSDCKRCLLWGEVSFNEALQRHVNAITSSTKDNWINTLTQLLEGINRCMSMDHSILKSLASKNLVRISHNLIKVIEISMDVPDAIPEMAISSVLPWILLFRIIQHEEIKLHTMQVVEGGEVSSRALDRCLPSSLMLLNIAHEYLGRRSWCMNSEGALLQFMVEIILERLKRDSDEPIYFRAELEQAMEQCVYCLYGHPNKRAKARHLEDHNVPQIGLTWERSYPVFEYFKPKTMPEFDSYKTSTVSGELENLLRRIFALVPQRIMTNGSLELLTSYVEGSSNQFPSLLDKVEQDVPIVKELFYLLADYHFKNKEQVKAIKYYMHDICFNPERFDSWAGMALARSSRLEQKLNAHELKTEGKTEGPIQKHAVAALRCFKRALELDSSNSKLWIEYGSLAYQLHSHASRQLKQQHIFPLTVDMLEIANNNKVDMLRLAQNCYHRASDCEAEDSEEEWLHHYMLGKCAEKMGRPPREFLEHYRQAAHHLHQDMARYPKKITYIYSPPHLAVESLEIFYRLHASILKYLLNHHVDLPYDVFEEFINEAAKGPFATCQEKKQERQPDGRDVSMLGDENSLSALVNTIATAMTSPTSTLASAASAGQKRPCRPTPTDHEYARQKSYDSGRSDNENSLDLRSDHETPKKQVINQRTGTMVTMSDSDSSPQALRKPCYTSSPYNSPPMCSTVTVSSCEHGRGSYPIVSSAASQLNPAAAASSTPSPFSMASILGDVITRELLGEGEKQKLGQKEAIPVVKVEDHCSPVKSSTPNISTPDNSPPKLVQITGATPRISPTDPLQEVSPPKLARMTEPDQPTSSTADEEYRLKITGRQPPTEVSDHDQVSSSSQLQSVSEALAGLQMLAAMGGSRPGASYGSHVGPLPQDPSEMDTMPTLDLVKPDTTSSPINQARNPGNDGNNAFPEASDSRKSPFDEPPKLEPMDTQDASGVPLGESSQDCMVAELERLKSEILALNESGGGSMFSHPLDSSASPLKEEPVDSDDEGRKKESESDGGKMPSLSSSLDESALEVKKEEIADSCALRKEIQPSIVPSIPTLDLLIVKTEREADTCTGTSIKDELRKVPTENEAAIKKDVVTIEDSLASDESKQQDQKCHGDRNSTTEEDTGQTSKAPAESCSNEEETIRLLKNLNDGSKYQEKVSSTVHEFSGSHKFGKNEANQPSVLDRKSKLLGRMEDKGRGIQGISSSTFGDSVCESNKMMDKKDDNEKEKDLKDDEEGGTGTGADIDKEEASSKKESKVVDASDKIPQKDEEEKQLKKTGQKCGNEKNTDSTVEVEKSPDSKSKTEETGGKGENGKSRKSGSSDKVKNDGVKDIIPLEERRRLKEADKRYCGLVDQCLQALGLCLGRFPQHYKCLYRLAYTHYHSKPHTDIQKCRNFLLGNAAWQHLDYMPCPGLYQERKHSNFFQGLWRIPVEEIDRSGSFAAHMMRSLLLLFQILKDSHDSRMLYHIHQQLTRTPDQGKKYLKDNDRIKLSTVAFEYTLDALDVQLMEPDMLNAKQETRDKFMLEVNKVWQYGLKLGGYAERLNTLLTKAFTICVKEKGKSSSSVLEQAVVHCQELQAFKTQMVASIQAESRLSLDPKPNSQGFISPPAKTSELSMFPGQGRSPGSDTNPKLSHEDLLRLTDPTWLTTNVQAKVPRLPSLDASERLQIPGVTPLPARDSSIMRSPVGRPSMAGSPVKSKSKVAGLSLSPHQEYLGQMKDPNAGALDLSKKTVKSLQGSLSMVSQSSATGKVSKLSGESSGVKPKQSLKGMPPTLKATPPSLKGMPPTKRLKTQNPAKTKPAVSAATGKLTESELLAQAVAKYNKSVLPQGVSKPKTSATSVGSKSVVKQVARPAVSASKVTTKAAAASSSKSNVLDQVNASRMASLAAMNTGYLNPMALASTGMFPYPSSAQAQAQAQAHSQALWSTIAMNYMAMNYQGLATQMTPDMMAEMMTALTTAQVQAQAKKNASSKTTAGMSSNKPRTTSSAGSSATVKPQTATAAQSPTSSTFSLAKAKVQVSEMLAKAQAKGSAKPQAAVHPQMTTKPPVSSMTSSRPASTVTGSHTTQSVASSSMVSSRSVSASEPKLHSTTMSSPSRPPPQKLVPPKTLTTASANRSQSLQHVRPQTSSNYPRPSLSSPRAAGSPVRFSFASPSSTSSVDVMNVDTPPRSHSSFTSDPSSPDCIVISSSQEDSD